MDRLLRRFRDDPSSSPAAWATSPLNELPLSCRDLLQSVGIEPSEAVLDFTATLAVIRYELNGRGKDSSLDHDAEIVESLQTRQRRAASAVDEVREENRIIASMPRTVSASAPLSPMASPSRPAPSLPLSRLERPMAHKSPASPASSPLPRMPSQGSLSSMNTGGTPERPISVTTVALTGYNLSPQDPHGTHRPEPPPSLSNASTSSSPAHSKASWFNLVSKSAKHAPASSPTSTSFAPLMSTPMPPLPLSASSPHPVAVPDNPHALPLSASQPSSGVTGGIDRSPRVSPSPRPSLMANWADALDDLKQAPPPVCHNKGSFIAQGSQRGRNTLPSAIMSSLIINEDPFKLYTQALKVGSGGSAEVFRCTIANNALCVAVKAYGVKIPGGEAAQANELDVLMHTQHTNLVAFHTAYLYRERVYAVVEYCNGGTLLALYKSVVLSEPVIAFCVGEVLSGLAYLHLHNRLHRDVKAENVMLTQNGEVKLADFGTADEVANAYQPGSANAPCVGTRYFMAPEMIRSEGYCSKADVWSTGCMLIELANRQVPYSELRSLRALLRIASVGAAPLKHPSKVGMHMQETLKKMTAYRWQDRPSAVQVLSMPFFAKRREGRAGLITLIHDAATDLLLPG